jgi:hypothetical protein
MTKMNKAFYGQCDHCGKKVASRHYALSRHIEQCFYPVPGVPGPQIVQVDVLHAEELTRYCCSECSEVGAYVQMQDRGIELKEIEPGPIAPCSKCGRMMDLRLAHVTFEMMDQTELRLPWFMSVQPHDSNSLARVCVNCDGTVDARGSSTEAVNLAAHADAAT